MKKLILSFLLIAIVVPALPAQQAWTEYPLNPIIGQPMQTGRAYYPSVLYEPAGFVGFDPAVKYLMWFGTEGPGITGTCTALATSADGIAWTNLGVVIAGYHTSVKYFPAGFAGANSGTNPGAGTMYFRLWLWDNAAPLYSMAAMRYAESPDGLSWYNSQPVKTIPGAVPIIGNGENFNGSAWNRGSYGPSDILYNPAASNTGTDWMFVMYYDGTTGGTESLGIGFSSDGIFWKGYDPDGNGKANPVFTGTLAGTWDSKYVSRGTVEKLPDGTFRMWYSGGSLTVDYGIGFATSADGLSWVRDAANPILDKDDVGYPGTAGWRSNRTYCPCVVKVGDSYRMWYAGKNTAGSYAIGLAMIGAVSVAPDAHDYGNVKVGGEKTFSFVITNTGEAPLDVTGVAFDGVDPGDFSVVGGFVPFTLAAAASQSLDVRFQPGAEGDRSATLKISASALDNNPAMVALSGKGVTIMDMASFAVEEAKLDWKKKPDDDKARVKGVFNLPDGAVPDPNAVSLKIGSLTFGPLALTKFDDKKWEYKRPKGTTGVKDLTIEWKKKEAKFEVRIDDADLGEMSGWTNPVLICLQIGLYQGAEPVLMKEHKDKWEYKK